jgi:IS1 family transposase
VFFNSFIQATFGHCSTLRERRLAGRTKKFKVHTPTIIAAQSLLSSVIIRSAKQKVRTMEDRCSDGDKDSTEIQNKYSTYGN